MNKQILENSSFDINIELNEKRITIILDKLLTFKNYTSKSQVSSMILFTLLKNINFIMKLNDNRYLLWAYIYCGLQRIKDKTPSEFEIDLCSMLINQISDLLEINNVFHQGVESFYNLMNKGEEEEEGEFNFLLSVLENIEANNIYVQHINILLKDFNLSEEGSVTKDGEKIQETTYKKDYIKVLEPLLKSMFINYGDFDESKITYEKYLLNKLNETKIFMDLLMKKGGANTKKPSERGLK